MTPLELFIGGAPMAPAKALAAAREARAGSREVTWHVDPSNVRLLQRFAAEAPEWRPGELTVLLRAVDEAPERTLVAHERELVPALRPLHARGASLRLTTGRAYTLPPPAVDVSTNDLCGLECVMCKNRAPRRDPKTMSPDEVRGVLAEVAAWGVPRVALTGAGEPFRDPEMLAYIRDANALGLRVNVTTNGFPVSAAVAAELARREVSVSVSIHGARPATHDAIVGVPRASTNAFRAVRRLVAARDAKPSRLVVNVSTVIQRANIGEIAALGMWAKRLGCNGFNVQPVNLQHGFVQGELIKRRDDVGLLATLWPTRADREGLARMAEELKELGRLYPGFVKTTEERLSLFLRYFEDASRASLGVECRVGEAFVGVDHRGAIKPCYRLPWSHGDARRVSLRALWNSAAYERTRGMIAACPLTCMNNCFFREENDGRRRPS